MGSSLTLAHLLRAVALSALVGLAYSPAAPEASTESSTESTRLGTPPEGALDPAPPTEAEPSFHTYYRFLDRSGSIHFVETLAQVPPGRRAEATRLELRPRPSRSPAPARAPERPRATLATMRRIEPPPAEAAPDRDAEVVVYTTSWCGWCRKTLAYLDRRGVEYWNRDIEQDREAASELRRKTGSTAIPVVDVDGELVRGYDQRRLEELIDAL